MTEENPDRLVLRGDESAVVGLPCIQCGNGLNPKFQPPGGEVEGHCPECATPYLTRAFRVGDHMMVYAVHFEDFCERQDDFVSNLPGGDLLN